MKKRTLFFVVLFFALVVVVGNFFFHSSSSFPSLPGFIATPTPVKTPPLDVRKLNYDKVFSDQTLAGQIAKDVQNPTDFKKQGDLLVISYPSSVDQRTNAIYEKDNTVQYVALEVTTDNTSLNDYRSTHPTSQSFQLYDPVTASAGFSWYIFPRDGIAFLANGDYGYAIRTLYFQSTTKEDFLNTTAKIFNMVSTDPYNENVQEPFTQTP